MESLSIAINHKSKSLKSFINTINSRTSLFKNLNLNLEYINSGIIKSENIINGENYELTIQEISEIEKLVEILVENNIQTFNHEDDTNIPENKITYDEILEIIYKQKALIIAQNYEYGKHFVHDCQVVYPQRNTPVIKIKNTYYLVFLKTNKVHKACYFERVNYSGQFVLYEEGNFYNILNLKTGDKTLSIKNSDIDNIVQYKQMENRFTKDREPQKESIYISDNINTFIIIESKGKIKIHNIQNKNIKKNIKINGELIKDPNTNDYLVFTGNEDHLIAIQIAGIDFLYSISQERVLKTNEIFRYNLNQRFLESLGINIDFRNAFENKIIFLNPYTKAKLLNFGKRIYSALHMKETG